MKFGLRIIKEYWIKVSSPFGPWRAPGGRGVSGGLPLRIKELTNRLLSPFENPGTLEPVTPEYHEFNSWAHTCSFIYTDGRTTKKTPSSKLRRLLVSVRRGSNHHFFRDHFTNLVQRISISTSKSMAYWLLRRWGWRQLICQNSSLSDAY